MITFSLADLTTPLTSLQVKKSIYDAFGVMGVNTTSWKPGAVMRTFVAAVSIIIAALSQLVAKIASMGFLELSSGDWLTLTAHYVYGVDRFVATFAAGNCTLTNSAGGVYVLAAGELVVASSATGKEYRNTGPITINALSTLTTGFEAVEAGADSTAFAGEIDTLVTVLNGVSVTNPLDIVGQDAEDDASLKQRCLDKLGSLSPNGPADAYAHFARSAVRAADGTSIGVNRVRTQNTADGNVYVWVATASGALSGTVGDVTTDLGAVDDNIQRNAVPVAITAHVASATTVPTPITYELWAYSTTGLTSDQLADNIHEALDQYFASQPIGGNVIPPGVGAIYLSEITGVIARANPQIFRVVVSAPAADVTLAASEVATLGAITPTINFISPTGL